MAGHPERWNSPFTPAELRRLWTYSDGAVTAKGYRVPDGTARAGSWVLADQATGEVQGVVPPGEFSRRFRPVPRRHRDGWSSATARELAARRTAMTLVAAWYRAMDGGHAVFCANDSPPNLDYRRDTEAAARTPAGASAAVTKNPRQEVQHAHLHAFYAEHDPTENHESSAHGLNTRSLGAGPAPGTTRAP